MFLMLCPTFSVPFSCVLLCVCPKELARLGQELLATY